MSSKRKAKTAAQKSVINVSDAKSRLSAILEEVAKGKKIILGKAGKPMATLMPFTEVKSKRKFGAMKGKIKFSNLEFTNQELKDLFGL